MYDTHQARWVLWGVIFTRPRIIHSLSSSESGNSVVHSGNQSTFSVALGWTNSKICETKRRKQHRWKKNSRLFCTTAYLWFITPVDIEFSLKALQSETKAPSPSLSWSLHNLFASLAKLPQTFTLTKAHLGLKKCKRIKSKNLRPKNQLKWTILDTETHSVCFGYTTLPWVSVTHCCTLKNWTMSVQHQCLGHPRMFWRPVLVSDPLGHWGNHFGSSLDKTNPQTGYQSKQTNEISVKDTI